MFKKPPAVTQTHKVSGADRKKIRRAVEKALHLAGPDGEAALEGLLPAKAGELEQAKQQAPARLLIFLLDGQPLLLDVSGKGDYLPTVLGLWRVPSLLPAVTLKHPAVSQFIVGGADVMLPGVDVSCLPDFRTGDAVAVVVPGNPAPIAVGVAAMHADAARAQAARDGKGRLVEVVQAYGDGLWAGLGARAVPNEGFLQGVVAGLAAPAADGSDGDGGAAAAAAAAAGGEGLSEALRQQLALDNEGGAAAAAAAGAGVSTSQEPAGPSSSGGGGGGGEAGSSGASSSPADMDSLLELALLQALVKSVKDDQLPLNSSTLWAQHITPCRPPETPLDVKKSSHKKMSKFLQVFAKAGLISTKEDKHGGDTILTAVNRSHELYTQHRPYKTAASATAAAAGAPAAAGGGGGMAAGAAAGGGAGGGGPAPSSSSCDPLVVEEVYKPTRETKPIFEAVGSHPDGLYSAQQAGDVAFAYARQAGLDAGSPDPRLLLLDATLCDALFKGLVKKGETFPTHIAKAELRDAFLRRLQQQMAISRGGQRLLRKGGPPAVAVSGERRQGNKYVTKVAGLEAFLVDPAVVAADCQKRFATATTLAPLPGKHNPGQEVLVQGNVVDKLPEYLIATYGIPKKYFLVKK